MDFDMQRVRPILERTPGLLDLWLRDLPEAWVRQDEGPDTWSAFDVLGHLIHGERTDWIPRARHLLEHGPARPFEPFDRQAQMATAGSETLAERLEVFATLRAENLVALDGLDLTPERLALQGTHPEFGTVTLGQLLSTWPVHDLGHLGQVARVLARAQSTSVGPWAAYLPVLHR